MLLLQNIYMYEDFQKKSDKFSIFHKINLLNFEYSNKIFDYYDINFTERHFYDGNNDIQNELMVVRNTLTSKYDLPCIIRKDGSKFWFRGGKLHRKDAPSIIWANGMVEFYLNGKHNFIINDRKYAELLYKDCRQISPTIMKHKKII